MKGGREKGRDKFENTILYPELYNTVWIIKKKKDRERERAREKAKIKKYTQIGKFLFSKNFQQPFLI